MSRSLGKDTKTWHFFILFNFLHPSDFLLQSRFYFEKCSLTHNNSFHSKLLFNLSSISLTIMYFFNLYFHFFLSFTRPASYIYFLQPLAHSRYLMCFLMVLLFQEAPTQKEVGEVKLNVANTVCRCRHRFILLIQVIFIDHDFFFQCAIAQGSRNMSRNKTTNSCSCEFTFRWRERDYKNYMHIYVHTQTSTDIHRFQALISTRK